MYVCMYVCMYVREENVIQNIENSDYALSIPLFFEPEVIYKKFSIDQPQLVVHLEQ